MPDITNVYMGPIARLPGMVKELKVAIKAN